MAKTMTKSAKSKKKEAAVDKEAARATQRQAVLSLVEAMHREKNISKDIIFSGIESAIQLAVERAAGEVDIDVLIHIDRATGEIIAQHGYQEELPLWLYPCLLGKIGSQWPFRQQV